MYVPVVFLCVKAQTIIIIERTVIKLHQEENYTSEFLRLLRDDKRIKQIIKEYTIKVITQSFSVSQNRS